MTRAARVELEEVALRGPAAVDREGVTARRLLRLVRTRGPRTILRLARELRLAARLIGYYVRALMWSGRLALGWSPRGKVLVSLAEAGRQSALRLSA